TACPVSPAATATMFAPLHHRRDDIFGIIKRSEASKPGDGILVTAIGGLGGSGFSSHLHIFQSRSSAGAAIFIDNFPKAFAHEIDLFSRKLTTYICSHTRRLQHRDLSVFVERRRAVL